MPLDASIIALLTIVLIAIVAISRHSAGPSKLQIEHPQAFSVLSIALAFDPDHAIIWETQIPALQLIASSGRDGILVRELASLYHQSARRYPELYEGSSFGNWLEFLRTSGLVKLGIAKVSLTSEGERFLQYRLTCSQPFQLDRDQASAG